MENDTNKHLLTVVHYILTETVYRLYRLKTQNSSYITPVIEELSYTSLYM